MSVAPQPVCAHVFGTHARVNCALLHGRICRHRPALRSALDGQLTRQNAGGAGAGQRVNLYPLLVADDDERGVGIDLIHQSDFVYDDAALMRRQRQ